MILVPQIVLVYSTLSIIIPSYIIYLTDQAPPPHINIFFTYSTYSLILQNMGSLPSLTRDCFHPFSSKRLFPSLLFSEFVSLPSFLEAGFPPFFPRDCFSPFSSQSLFHSLLFSEFVYFPSLLGICFSPFSSQILFPSLPLLEFVSLSFLLRV